MSTPFRRLALAAAFGLTVTAAWAADKEFRPGPADRYPSRQSQNDVTVAVRAYHDPERAATAFGKTDPYKHGVLPVLVVVTNGGKNPVSLAGMKPRFVQGRNEGVEPISGDDLAYFNPKGAQPRQNPSMIPGIPGVTRPKVKRGPLARPEIVERQFKAPVVAPGETASGFFYYHVGRDRDPLSGATIYLSGLRDMTSGQELFYFEISLEEE